MPRRHVQTYMIVKTPAGDVKIDKNGNRLPLDDKTAYDNKAIKEKELTNLALTGKI